MNIKLICNFHFRKKIKKKVMIKAKDMGKFIQLNDMYGKKIWTAEKKQRDSFFKQI